jgi:hypothetical protein
MSLQNMQPVVKTLSKNAGQSNRAESPNFSNHLILSF